MLAHFSKLRMKRLTTTSLSVKFYTADLTLPYTSFLVKPTPQCLTDVPMVFSLLTLNNFHIFIHYRL